MQPRRLRRAAGKLCRKHAWNARSKQRHVTDAKQVLVRKGWVHKQRLHDVQSRVGAAATRARVESPLRTELVVDSCSVRHQGNCCTNTREISQTCSSGKTVAFSRREHTWISLRAQARRHVHATDCCVRTPQAHLDLFPLRKETCSGKTTAALSRHEHTWISLRAQRDMFHRKDCCDLALPPKIHDFYLRTADPASTVKRAHIFYAIGNP